MKTILSLILPDNEDSSISKRFLKGGRKAIGFHDQQLVTVNASGIEQGYGSLTADDIQTAITTDDQLITKRCVTFSGRTAATVAKIPSPSGELRELLIVNANTSSGNVTVSTNPLTTINGSAVVNVTTSGRFLSNGTNWYRVS